MVCLASKPDRFQVSPDLITVVIFQREKKREDERLERKTETNTELVFIKPLRDERAKLTLLGFELKVQQT